jgi:hypothetical protein
MLLHKLRRAIVAPEREPLKGEIEADEWTSPAPVATGGLLPP